MGLHELTIRCNVSQKDLVQARGGTSRLWRPGDEKRGPRLNCYRRRIWGKIKQLSGPEAEGSIHAGRCQKANLPCKLLLVLQAQDPSRLPKKGALAGVIHGVTKARSALEVQGSFLLLLKDLLGFSVKPGIQ